MQKHFLHPKHLLKPTSLFFFLLLSGLTVLGQIPSGYYSTAEGKSGFELKTALYNIVKGHSTQSYASLWTHFESTDKKANGKVWDMYSDIPGGTPPYEFTFGSDQCGNYSAESDCYNREHSFPKSWFSDAAPMDSDLFHLVPSDGYVNGRRGSHPYGETNNASWTSQNGSKLGTSSTTGYSGTVFEPIDEYKGDLARGYFYMATRYENVISGWPGSEMLDGSSDKVFTDWALTLLKAWHEADPVSQKEIDRNNAIYGIQNNRNPYIDHPEWVNEVWNGTTGGGGNNGGNNETIVFEQNFDNCDNLNGWSQFSVSGDQVWECSNFGNNSTTGVRMNGFASDASNVNEDWLISTALTIASGNNLNFDVERRFDGPDLEVKISSDYTGTGSPASATWTDLSASIPAPAASNDIWNTVSGIDLSSFAGSNRYIAFVYTSTATNSSRFTLDNVTLTEAGTGSTDPTLSTSAPGAGFNFGYVVAGNSSASQSYTLTAANLTADVSLTTAAPFAISTDNTTFSTSLTIPQASANGATIHVRFSPTTADGQVSNGSISHATTGVTTFNVSLTGTEGEANTNVQTIQSVRDAVDADGVPTTTGEVTVAGRVHGVNLNPSTTGNFQFSLIDATGAITIRNGSGTSLGDIQEGDDIEITGTIGHYNGLMQLTPTQTITVVSSGNARYTPVAVSTLDEAAESQLVRLSNVSIPTPAQWTGSASNTGSFNVDITVGGNTLTMRIDRNTELSKLTYQQVFGTAESGISIAGLGGQFDSSAPHNSGYQIFPYLLSDIDNGQGTNPVLTGTAPAAGLDFGRIVAGQVSEGKNYTLVASNLTADVSLSVTSAFELSADNTNWATNLTIAQASANGATVYVRFVPTVANAQLYTGTITHSSTGVADYQVGVFGQEGQATGGEASFLEDFDDCVDIAGWVNFSVLGDQVWECIDFGNNGTPGVRMNGFAGQSNANEDWLISPELTISNGEALSFDVERRFSGQDMEVKISSNYSGSGDPSSATWETLPFTMPAFAATNDVWNTLETDMSAYAGSGKYIAFVYYSTSEGSSRFTIDNVRMGISAGNAVEVYFPSKEYFVTENTTTPITLQLAKPAVANEQVIINYQLGTNVTFGAAGDVQTTPAENAGQITLNVTEGAQSVSFLVKANNDTEVEERESITFSILTTSGGLRAQAGNESAVVNIIDNNPTSMTIKAARQITAKGLASLEHEVVRLQGVVHGVNWAANKGKVEFVIIDPAAASRAGIVVRANGGYTVTEGDIVQVDGSLRTDKGLQYVAASLITKQTGAGTLVAPVEVSQLDESREADLVSLYGLQIMSGWGDDLGGYYEVIATNGVKQYLIRIDANTDIFEEAAPEAFSVSGIVWQRDTEAPYDGEYYLLPRGMADFSFLTAAPDALDNQVKVYPNPSEGIVQLTLLAGATVQVFDMQGHVVYADFVMPNEWLDLRHLNNGMYFLRVQNGKSTATQKLIIKK